MNQECACLHDQVSNPSGDQAEMLVCSYRVVQDSFPHQPEGVDSPLMGKWIMTVKVHILQSEDLFGCSLGYPLHLRNPACVTYQGIVCKSLLWSVPGLRSHPYYLTLPPLLHRLPGYILLLFLFQGLLKVPYISPEAMLRAAGTKNRTNCLAV